MLALCVASHHSGLIDCIAPDGMDVLTRRLNKDSALSHRDEALEPLKGRYAVVWKPCSIARILRVGSIWR